MDPPAVIYLYAPGRGAEHAIRPLAGFSGVLQVDAYAAYNALGDPARDGGPVTLAYCWSHVRRGFYEIAQGGVAPIAEEGLALARHPGLADDLSGRIHHVNAAPFQQDVDRGIVLHGCPSMLMLGAARRTPSTITVRDSRSSEKAEAATRPDYRI